MKALKNNQKIGAGPEQSRYLFSFGVLRRIPPIGLAIGIFFARCAQMYPKKLAQFVFLGAVAFGVTFSAIRFGGRDNPPAVTPATDTARSPAALPPAKNEELPPTSNTRPPLGDKPQGMVWIPGCEFARCSDNAKI